MECDQTPKLDAAAPFTSKFALMFALLSFFESRNWSHPFDNEGKRLNFRDMPKTLSNLADDPFRSLAGALKRAGGYKKNNSLFSEFRWADFLRCWIRRQLIERDFDQAVAQAMSLARSCEAQTLPGWTGASNHTPRADTEWNGSLF